MAAVKCKQLGDIYIRHPVSIGQKEGFLPNIGLYALHSSACHGIQPRIYKGNPPGLRHIIMHGHLILLSKIKGHITVMEIIIRKPLLYHMLLIAAADNKIMNSIMRVALHNMPENGFSSDLYHGLWF